MRLKFILMVIGLVVLQNLFASHPNLIEDKEWIELTSERTFFTKTFMQEDGTFKKIYSSIPLHYKDENANFIEIPKNVEQSKRYTEIAIDQIRNYNVYNSWEYASYVALMDTSQTISYDINYNNIIGECTTIDYSDYVNAYWRNYQVFWGVVIPENATYEHVDLYLEYNTNFSDNDSLKITMIEDYGLNTFPDIDDWDTLAEGDLFDYLIDPYNGGNGKLYQCYPGSDLFDTFTNFDLLVYLGFASIKSNENCDEVYIWMNACSITLYYTPHYPVLSVNPTLWNNASGESTSDSLTISVTNSSINNSQSISYDVSESVGWLTLSSLSGTTPGSFDIEVDEKNFTGSTRDADVRVEATFPTVVLNSPVDIPVTQGLAETCTLPDDEQVGCTLYATTNWIEVDDTFVVADEETLTLRATNTITLGPGFHAQSGSTFLAEIETVSEKDDGIVTKPKTTVNTNDAASNSEEFNDPEEQYQEPLDSDDVIVNIPNDYCLMANYPNPFNPSTTIRFGLPERSDVNLQVYNIKGQIIKTLESNALEAGYHEVSWNGDDNNGKNVSSGIYFYKLSTDKFTSMKRMLLIK